MPRANRHRIAGQVWHITQRCHRREFLLKFARDRRAWVGWLYEARKRFGLCVLDYQVTSNHVHLLVLDRGRDEIAASMQLIAPDKHVQLIVLDPPATAPSVGGPGRLRKAEVQAEGCGRAAARTPLIDQNPHPYFDMRHMSRYVRP